MTLSNPAAVTLRLLLAKAHFNWRAFEIEIDLDYIFPEGNSLYKYVTNRFNVHYQSIGIWIQLPWPSNSIIKANISFTKHQNSIFLFHLVIVFEYGIIENSFTQPGYCFIHT